MKRNSYPRILAAVGFSAGLLLAVLFLPIKSWTAAFLLWIHGLGAAGAMVYALAYIAGTVLLVPGTVLTAGAGLVYGTFIGTLIVSPASVLGATLAFIIARYFARGGVESRLERYPKFRAIDRAIEKNGFKVVFLLRLEPIFIPFALLNYALGLTGIRLRDYVLASWLGMLPATILYVYLGSALHNISDLFQGRLPEKGIWEHALFWCGLVATAALVLLLGRIAKKALDAELDKSPDPERSIA